MNRADEKENKTLLRIIPAVCVCEEGEVLVLPASPGP